MDKKPEDFKFVVNDVPGGQTVHRGTCGHAGNAESWTGYDEYVDIPRVWKCKICWPQWKPSQKHP